MTRQSNEQVEQLTEGQFHNIIKEGALRILESIANSDSNPKVYVGTYAKYNNGSLYGKWLDLEDFSDYEEFIEACREIHKDEADPEFMFQDNEFIPSIFGGESWIAPEIFDYINEKTEYDFDVKYALAEYCSDRKEYFSKIDDIRVYAGCDDMEDVVLEYVDQMGGLENAFDRETLQNHFDYERYGRDCSFDGPSDDTYESIYEEYGVSEDDDEALGEALIDAYGWDAVSDESMIQYFDYKGLGEQWEHDGNFISYSDGYIDLCE